MIRALLRNCGFDRRRAGCALRGLLRYTRDRKAFEKAAREAGWSWGRELPILTEWEDPSGTLGPYFFQDHLVARWILDAAPSRHIDVGSRLDGFVGHLALSRAVDVIDIRPSPLEIPNVRFHQLDLMQELPAAWRSCTDSLSCLHTIEHFGLGRYGDPLDVHGHLKGLDRLKRMVRGGGMLYLSTPVGIERVEFNAHRVFAPRTLCSWFDDDWSIERCAVIDADCKVRQGPGAGVLRDFSGDTGIGVVAARRRIADEPLAANLP